MLLYITLFGFLVAWLGTPWLLERRNISYANGLLVSGIGVCLAFAGAMIALLLGVSLANVIGPSSFDTLHVDFWPLPGMVIGFFAGVVLGRKIVRKEPEWELDFLKLGVYSVLVFIAIVLLVGGFAMDNFPDD